MHDEVFADLPADLLRRHVGHSYGSTTAVYMAMRDERDGLAIDELDLGGDDA